MADVRAVKPRAAAVMENFMVVFVGSVFKSSVCWLDGVDGVDRVG